MLIIFRNSLADGPISLFARNFFSFITTFCLWLFACLPFSPVHVHLSLIISVGLFLPLSSFSSSLFLVLLLLHFSWPLSNFLLSSSSSYLFVFLLILLFLASSSLPCSFTPLIIHLSLLPALSGKSLWRWILSRCVSTATNACRTTWSAGWPSVSATRKRRRRNWYPCVCDPLFLLSPHFHYCSFGQFSSSFLSDFDLLLFHCHPVSNMPHTNFVPHVTVISYKPKDKGKTLMWGRMHRFNIFKGTFQPKIKNIYCLPVALFILVWVAEFWRCQLYKCPPFLVYSGMKWYSAIQTE